jgi:hypothetical protein
MSQNDFTIADQSFPNFRADLNLALQALASLSSGATAPTVPFANQLWYETDTDTLWLRNEGNTAWLDLMRINQTTGSPSFMSGNVGIGTTAPSRALHVKNSTAIVRIEDTDTAVSTIYGEIQSGLNGELIFNADPGNASGGATAIQFFLDAAEKARITSAGNVLIGTSSSANSSLSVTRDITGGANAFGILNNGEIQTDAITTVQANRTAPTVVAAHPGLSQLIHYAATQGTIGAGSTVTTQVGFMAESNLIGAASNIGFWHPGVAAASVTAGKTIRAMQSSQAAASGGGTAHNLYILGTAPSYFAGNLGLGTDAPARVLHVKNTNPSIRLEDTDTGVSTIYAEIDTTTSGSLFLKADPGNAAAGSNIQFEIDASEKLRIGPSGQIGIAGANYGTAGQPLVSGGSGGAVAWGPILTSGTYTPTLTTTGALTANIQAATAFAQTQYSRNGDMVTVFGSVSIDPTTAATDTILLMSLPIASTFTSARKLAGTGAAVFAGKYGEALGIEAEITTNQASISLRPSGAGNVPYTFSFTYQVI